MAPVMEELVQRKPVACDEPVFLQHQVRAEERYREHDPRPPGNDHWLGGDCAVGVDDCGHLVPFGFHVLVGLLHNRSSGCGISARPAFPDRGPVACKALLPQYSGEYRAGFAPASRHCALEKLAACLGSAPGPKRHCRQPDGYRYWCVVVAVVARPGNIPRLNTLRSSAPCELRCRGYRGRGYGRLTASGHVIDPMS